MLHTVSSPNRNWFGTGFDTEDSVEFEKLIKLGFATKEISPKWMGDDVIYRLTEAGRQELKGAVA